MARLFVNVDHVATVRQARGVDYPDPVTGALLAEQGGAEGITVHLREDRRHIQDADVARLQTAVSTPFNLELAVSEEIVRICEEARPEQATLVPEKREEVTTEGGLDMVRGFDRLAEVTRRFVDRGIVVSMFIDPDSVSVEKSAECGATHIELHTGAWANANDGEEAARELDLLEAAAARARELGLVVNAGHGLHYENTAEIAAIDGMNDLNIGHSIVARAVEIGMTEAVRRMAKIVRDASGRREFR